MKFTRRYIVLSEYLISKRDVSQGGVDGYNSGLDLNLEQFTKLYIGEWEGIKEMLDKMTEEIVWIKDEDGDKHEKTAIKSWQKKNGRVIITGCTTEQLKQFIKKLKNDFGKSVIKCNRSVRPKKIKYLDNDWVQLSNKGRRYAFWSLYKNFPKPVSYLNLAKEIGITNKLASTLSINDVKKVQNVVNGLKSRLAKSNFPEDIIVNDRESGYQLTI